MARRARSQVDDALSGVVLPPEATDQFGSASASDVRAMRQQSGQRDNEHQTAYEAGYARRGSRADFEHDPELANSYDAGAQWRRDEEAAGGGEPSRRRERRVASSSGRRIASAPGVDDGAGFILGAVAYVALLNFLRGGMPAVRGWFSAKFVNKVTYTPSPADQLTPIAPVRAFAEFAQQGTIRMGRPS